MALHFESAMLPPTATRGGQATPREQLRATVGKVFNMQMIRRKQGDDAYLERAAIAVGRPLTALPERGVSVAMSVPTFDVDSGKK